MIFDNINREAQLSEVRKYINELAKQLNMKFDEIENRIGSIKPSEGIGDKISVKVAEITEKLTARAARIKDELEAGSITAQSISANGAVTAGNVTSSGTVSGSTVTGGNVTAIGELRGATVTAVGELRGDVITAVSTFRAGAGGVDGNMSFGTASGGNITSNGTVEAATLKAGNVGVHEAHDSETAKALSSGTWTDTNSTFTLSSGVYVLSYSVRFASNGTGRRGARIVNANNSLVDCSYQIAAASDNGAVGLNGSAILYPSSSTEYKLQAYQNSGGSLNVTASYLRIVRIK